MEGKGILNILCNALSQSLFDALVYCLGFLIYSYNCLHCPSIDEKYFPYKSCEIDIITLVVLKMILTFYLILNGLIYFPVKGQR